MLRSRSILFALSFSVILSLGAFWVRTTQTKEALAQEAMLVTQNNLMEADRMLVRKEVARDLENNPGVDQGPRSDTDLIGRQLFGDYLGLINTGQATPDNLNALADSYAQNILSTSKTIQYSRERINIVLDNPENFQTYATRLDTVRKKYKNLTEAEVTKMGGPDKVPANLSKFATIVSGLYKQSLNELVLIPVPTSLSDSHLNLVNNYVESINNVTDLGNVDLNPAGAFSALNNQALNSQEEAGIILNIAMILNAQGINFSSSI